MTEQTIDLYFEMPFSTEKLFDFIILPGSLSLFTGFMMIPGVLRAESTHLERGVGTRDYVLNKDRSSHFSTTTDLVYPSQYNLFINQMRHRGYKKILTSILLGLRDEWTITPLDGGTKSAVHRKIVILRTNNLFAKFIISCFFAPQLKKSMLIHHQNIIDHLK